MLGTVFIIAYSNKILRKKFQLNRQMKISIYLFLLIYSVDQSTFLHIFNSWKWVWLYDCLKFKPTHQLQKKRFSRFRLDLGFLEIIV